MSDPGQIGGLEKLGHRQSIMQPTKINNKIYIIKNGIITVTRYLGDI